MNVVVIGGGTGSFVALRGLKDRCHATAIVSMFDSGGSAGLLRDEFGVLPPGDVRRCLVALAEEGILRELFMYRFEKGSLQGHSFGNLFLTALRDVVGDEAGAIEYASRILRIRGRVVPVSLEDAHVHARLEDARVVKGERNIDVPTHDPKLRIVNVWLDPAVSLNPAVPEVVDAADLIVLGPGDLFTSVIPNLLMEGLPEVLRAARARKVYVCNLMTKPGETTNFTASDHVREIMQYGFVPDVMVCGTVPETAPLERYAQKGQYPVLIDASAVPIVRADLTSKTDLVRHDSDLLAEVLLKQAL